MSVAVSAAVLRRRSTSKILLSKTLCSILPQSGTIFHINHQYRLLSTSRCLRSRTNDDDTREPPPIRVSLTSSAGRGVFATKSIQSGDLIHTAMPIVAHPAASLLSGVSGTVCYYCLRRLGAGMDGGDKRFCGDKCEDSAKVFYEVERRADWSAFDDYCIVQGLKYPFLVKRLACMVVCGTMSASSLNILQPTTLPSNAIPQMEEEFELLKGAFSKTEIEDEYLTFLTMQWYIDVLARIHINAFRIELTGGSYTDLHSLASASVVSEASVGNAVYMLPSFYNHDCDPNTHIIWVDSVDAKLKALRDIEADEELRICYIDTSMDRDARQRILHQGFGFHCNCPRCKSGD